MKLDSAASLIKKNKIMPGMPGMLKTREWKNRKWKTWHQNAGVDNVGVDLAVGCPVCRTDIGLTMVMRIFRRLLQ